MPTREALSLSQRAPCTDIPKAVGERGLSRYYRPLISCACGKGEDE